MHTVYPVQYTYKPQSATVTLSASAETAMRKHLSNRTVEQGGILGMEGGVITHYHHDALAQCDCNLFRPSAGLNEVIARWHQEGIITFIGLAHSHPADWPRLSGADLDYVRSLLTANPQLPAVLMAIIAGEQLLFYGFEQDYLRQ